MLAYLISEMLPSALAVAGLGAGYESLAQSSLTLCIIRSAVCAVMVICLGTGLNRVGFRLKL